jgi:hypothetical protein
VYDFPDNQCGSRPFARHRNLKGSALFNPFPSTGSGLQVPKLRDRRVAPDFVVVMPEMFMEIASLLNHFKKPQKRANK